MKIVQTMPETAMLEEMGRRAQQQRVGQNLTQTQLAGAAGVSARTIERFEAGSPVQLDKFVRIMRALRLSDNLDQLIPENEIRPLQLIGAKTSYRQRASSRRSTTDSYQSGWAWGDKK
ncbi:helix-turn-helix domain-containing protein [Nostoc sp. CHAB 5715]|nr:helix-turn-helix domain-containing protein [Nostoc sp. CHAB 5715]